METEHIAIGKVKPNEDNPRIIKDEMFQKLVKSIKEFPKMLELRPIVVNKNMIVLGGNMRLKACIEAGLKKVYIVKAENLSIEEQKRFIIADNVGFGEWDWEMLGNTWDEEQLKEWGMDVWQPDEVIDDIEEVDEISESVNFSIRCENLEQLEALQSKLNVSAMKISYKDFLVKAAL